ncbi:hypothetical protein AGR2A_pb10077 [Agrobacterium genomosp. 2 str. CFBP 5494]|uniref:Uncharacterized protein n=1 Tax=Agrobacterium genomosp. 2 str. CFBP 5494 TaxID=1183436 RepID=A0A9W5B7V3_9HYPH|nr:hypothetical protein AGR2A_pb10077 [Agrobacterium genomosp. 2 str. CFBP 5494]
MRLGAGVERWREDLSWTINGFRTRKTTLRLLPAQRSKGIPSHCST